jgi:hypothetical protein
MKKTIPRSTRAFSLRSWRVLAGLLAPGFALIVAGGLSPSAAGYLDAVIVTTLSLGDDASLSSTAILRNLDDRVSVVTVNGGPVTGDLGDGLIDASDSVSEAFPGDLTDDSGNPITIEGLWSIRLDYRGELDKVQMAAVMAGPGLYDDPDWFDSVTLVLLGGGAGVALVSLGVSRIRLHRRHRARSPSRRRSHRRPHRAR